MKRILWTVLLLATVLALPPEARAGDDSDDDSPGFFHRLLMYVPNRVFDVFDIVRARVRLGPGLAVDARVTELADVYAGSYATVYAGLPGPRNRKLPRLPVGLETRTGVEASVVDATVEAGLGPEYGPAEVGAGVQLALIGVDIGVEPVEILDLVAGFFFFDIKGDDW